MLTRRTGAADPGGAADDPGGARARAEYELARLPREMTTAVTWYMRERGITKRELAQRLEVTPGRVSQILSGDENLTLRTLAAVCAALGARLRVELAEDKPAGASLVTFTAAAGAARQG